jgi:nitroreductase
MMDGESGARRPAGEAILTRRSIRAYLLTPVEGAVVREILATASRAPSGNNIQPWRVYVTAGAAREGLSAAIIEAWRTEPEAHEQEYIYSLTEWREPYRTRRRVVGWGLYDLLGITKGDREGSRRQYERNFVFFDAPVGMIFTIERDLGRGSWLDLGMFLENIMTAARARGLDTCPEAALAPFHKVIRPRLDIPEEEIVVCGMALGHADERAPVNTLQTPREPVEGFARFFDI